MKSKIETLKREKGFTLIEVMIAIVIFGFLMTMVAQIMNGEIRMLNSATRQNEVEQKARTALMHILDEIKLNRYTRYTSGESGTGFNEGIYKQEPGHSREWLINLYPSGSELANTDTMIYYDRSDRKLMYKENGVSFLIADDIESINISEETPQLLRILVKASDSLANTEYELLTWTRLY